MHLFALKQQQSLWKRLTKDLLLSLLVAVILLFMGAMPSYAAPYSPPSYWAKTYGRAESEYGNVVQQTLDGGFIVGGRIASSGVDRQDLWVVKLDSDGNIQWQKAYNTGENEWMQSLQQTSDRGYIVAGQVGETLEGSREKFWVLKLEEDGSVEWDKSYEARFRDRAHAIQQTLDGGYITAGLSIDEGMDGDILILKLDALGNIEWRKLYGGPRFERRAENIRQTIDEGFILMASRSGGTIWVLKLDASGDSEWQYEYEDTVNLDGEDIQLTSDGGYIILAERANDCLLLKLGADGDIRWQTSFGGSESEDLESLRQTRDGGYIVGGSTASFGASEEPDPGDPPTRTDDVWLVKLDSDGNIQWEKTFGGNVEEFANSVVQTSDGGYVAAGSTNSFGSGGMDFLVLRLNEDGDIRCCLDDFLRTSESTVTPVDITETETFVEGEDIDVIMTPTSASEIDTSAIVKKLCFVKVVLPGVALCLTSWVLNVQNSLMIGLFVVAAVGLILLIVVIARRRNDQQPE